MNPNADLMRLFAEWRQLTEREGWAILGDDWKGVAEQQDKKQRLRLEMTRAFGLIRAAQPPRGNPSGEDQQRLDSIVSELVALEARNRDLVSAKSQSKHAELQRLNGAARNLQRVRRAYGASDSHHWQSYS
jgi:hypothetical protein